MGQSQRIEAEHQIDSASKFSQPETSSNDKKQGPEMLVEYSNEQQTETFAYSINGARLNIEPLRRREFIDSNAQRLIEAEHAVAEGRDLENDQDLQEIHDQLRKTQLEGGGVVKCLSAVFREYGDQIGMLKRDHGSAGLDSLKLGNQLDFADPNNMILVISEAGADEMKKKLENPPQNSIGEPGMKFRFTPPNFESNYLVNDDGEQMGFSVFLTYSSDKGDNVTEIRRIFFLFAKDKHKSTVENDAKDNKNEVQNNIEPQAGSDEEVAKPNNSISLEEERKKRSGNTSLT
ncbi:MAG TPA: hypothetical protein DEB09_02300 [Candidatus Magasanikbacteria bacterium]|nr:hypothetical protein [Candidatus Magasanikbacteria bacterium]